MSEQKHTPGPWTHRVAANGDRGVSAEGTGIFIEAYADIRFAGENARHEAEANARLIVAAPDLLQMLKVAQLWLEVDGRYDMQGINAAIAKAEGR